jgi:RNA polymerase sigma-70 factor (ECF subfamily)
MGTSQLTIARLIIDDWRWRRLRPEFRVQGPPVSDDHWNDVNAALQSRLVGDALHRLSAKHRDVLLECFYRGCSIAEGAIALEVPEPPSKLRCLPRRVAYAAARARRAGHEQ